MRRLLAGFVAFVVSIAILGTATAQGLPQPPEVAAQTYYLIDLTSNQVLAEKNADQPADPASLTKLMTAYLVFQALKDKKLTLEQALPVSKRARAERRGDVSVMYLETTMTPTVDQLLRGLIVQSANDAAVALAEGVAGSPDAFVGMMNRQAEAWGLQHTTFKNATGATEAGHRTTAREIAVVAAHVIRDFPDRYPYYAQRDFTFNDITQSSANLLLRRDPSVDGMKTGYTDAAGWCMVASAQRDFPNGRRRLLSVVMKAASAEARANESQKLLNWGFAAFDAVRLFDDGKALATVPVWKGTAATVKLGAAGAVFITVPKGEGGKLKTRIERSDPLVAPLAKGQRVGSLKVATASGAPIADLPLVVQDGVEQAGMIGRGWDALRLWIK